jgi:hypothetical protein
MQYSHMAVVLAGVEGAASPDEAALQEKSGAAMVETLRVGDSPKSASIAGDVAGLNDA